MIIRLDRLQTLALLSVLPHHSWLEFLDPRKVGKPIFMKRFVLPALLFSSILLFCFYPALKVLLEFGKRRKNRVLPGGQ